MNDQTIYEALKHNEHLFDGVWKSCCAYFKFLNATKVDKQGHLCVKAVVYTMDSGRRKTLYYPVWDVLNYMVLKSKINKVRIEGL